MSHPSTGTAEPRPTEEFFKSLTGNGAIFSPSRKYRYALWRSWDEGKGRVLFVMLNPSIADETKDDPTQRRCRRFAKDWGYAGYMVANLYAYVSTDPRNLNSGDWNISWIVVDYRDIHKLLAILADSQPKEEEAGD